MRDYDAIKEALTFYAATAETTRKTRALLDAADAIEELVALARMNDWCRCKNCSLQHLDSDGLLWCEELSMIVSGDFCCGYFEGTEPLPDPPKEVQENV